MSNNIDVQIQTKEAELSPLRQRMEESKLEFIKEALIFAADWYRKTVKEYVAKYSQVTLNMSEEKIAQMKAEVNVLIHNTDKAIDELGRPELWWHERPNLHDPIDLYTQVADKHPAILDRAMRHVLGRLGIILEEFRYHVTVTGSPGAYQEFWFDRAQGVNSAPVPYYPHILRWSQSMQDTIQAYNELFLRAMAVFKEIQDLKDLKKRQQAMNRWDSI